MSRVHKSKTKRRKHGNSTAIIKCGHRSTPDTGRDCALAKGGVVPLSDGAALRAMLRLSPGGQSKLFSMMRFTWRTEITPLVLRDAARNAGLLENHARAGLLEVMACRLLSICTSGTVALHPLFAATGHAWKREAVPKRNKEGEVVTFPNEYTSKNGGGSRDSVTTS